jgi:hypothetical protein
MDAKSTLSYLVVVAGMWVTAQAATVRRPVRARRMPPAPPMNLSADDVNNAGLTPDLSAKAKGSSVVLAQILLDRAHFSCGEIDGYYGSNLSKMVVASSGRATCKPMAIWTEAHGTR